MPACGRRMPGLTKYSFHLGYDGIVVILCSHIGVFGKKFLIIKLSNQLHSFGPKCYHVAML